MASNATTSPLFPKPIFKTSCTSSGSTVVRVPNRVIALYNKSRSYEDVAKNNFGFQSTFHEYLKAMESVKNLHSSVQQNEKFISEVDGREKNVKRSKDIEVYYKSSNIRRSCRVTQEKKIEESCKFSSNDDTRFSREEFVGVENKDLRMISEEKVRDRKLVTSIQDVGDRRKRRSSSSTDWKSSRVQKMQQREELSKFRTEHKNCLEEKLESVNKDVVKSRNLKETREKNVQGGKLDSSVHDLNESLTSDSSIVWSGSRIQQLQMKKTEESSRLCYDGERFLYEELGGPNFGLVKNGGVTVTREINARVINLEPGNSFSGDNTRVEEQERMKYVRLDSNQNLNEGEIFSESIKCTSSRYEKKIGGSNMVSNMQERYHGALDNMSDADVIIRPRRKYPYVRSDREAERNENRLIQTSQKLIRGNMEDVDENDLETERAAFKSFEVFTDVRGRPRVSRMELEDRIEKLAKWLNGTDINLPQWLFSKMMRSAQIRYTDHSILRVVQILGKFGNWRRVLQVIEWFQSREHFKSYKSRYIYTAALDVLGKTKRPAEALNVFHAMRQEFYSYPDLASYHCIAVTLGQAGYLKELFDVIDCMQSPPGKKFKTRMLTKWDPSLKPDIVVYNSVLNACVRRKQWEGAFWVLQQLKHEKLQTSSTTYGLMMEVMFACDKYNLVHEFFRKVERSSIPNSLNYRVMVNTLWKEGKTDEAVLVVEDMERRGIVGSASLYYDLARCLCSAGRCQEALSQIDKICKVANRPLVVTYTGLIQACLDIGNVENGAYIFKQMHKFCCPNLVTCNIMLRAYAQYKMFDYAKDLFQKMLGDNNIDLRSSTDASYPLPRRVSPDNFTFNTMLDACVVEQKWDVFVSVYQQMLHYGYNFNTKRHVKMILEACRAGKGDLLEITWKHLVKASRIPPPQIVKERFCMKLVAEDYSEAISSINIVASSCNEKINNMNLLLHAFSQKSWFILFKVNSHRFQKNTLSKLRHELQTLFAGSDRLPLITNLINACEEFIQADTYVIENDRNLVIGKESV